VVVKRVCHAALTLSENRLQRRFMLAGMKLYHYFRSSASYRVRIALAHKGLTWEHVPVNLLRGEQLQPDYAGLVADPVVPLLVLDSGQSLTQSVAIIEYLEEVYPLPPLLPSDALGRARVRALAQSVACEIHPLNNLRVLKYLVSDMGVSAADKTRWYAHWVRQGLEAFERQLSTGPAGVFCHGDTPTLADCLLVPQIFNAQRFNVPLNGLVRVQAVFDACMQLDAFSQTQPDACPDAQS
jgi:maleylacetoacetate isomerase/maleylpyruvate isomerase